MAEEPLGLRPDTFLRRVVLLPGTNLVGISGTFHPRGPARDAAILLHRKLDQRDVVHKFGRDAHFTGKTLRIFVDTIGFHFIFRV